MMKKLLVLFLLLCSSITFASPIKHVVFFGDSLTDDGNLHHYFPIIPKDPPYYAGRFTNGPTWAEHLGKYLATHYQISYENYAVGGSTVILRCPFIGALPVNLWEQMGDYLWRTSSKDVSESLIVIWSGANDYLDVKKQDTDSLTSQVVDKLYDDIEALYDKGAKNFLVLGIPDLSKTPRPKDAALTTRLHTLTVLNNQKLQQAMQRLQNKYPNAKFVYMDTDELVTDVLSNPAKYHLNLTHINEPCWDGGYTKTKAANQNVKAELDKLAASDPEKYKNLNTQAAADYILQSTSLQEAYRVSTLARIANATRCSNPDEYAFWDGVHPTEALHKVLGDLAAQKVVGFF